MEYYSATNKNRFESGLMRWMNLEPIMQSEVNQKEKDKYCILRLRFFQWSCMDVRVGLWRKLSVEELMLLNCGVGKTLESSLDCKEIQPVHPKGDQSWVFFGRNDAKAETPILWPPHEKSWLIRKDFDAGKDWGQEEKRTTEDEMAGWHHQLDGFESEWTPGVGDGQGGLECCDAWGHKESDMIEWLNWTELLLRSSFLSASAWTISYILGAETQPRKGWDTRLTLSHSPSLSLFSLPRVWEREHLRSSLFYQGSSSPQRCLVTSWGVQALY